MAWFLLFRHSESLHLAVSGRRQLPTAAAVHPSSETVARCWCCSSVSGSSGSSNLSCPITTKKQIRKQEEEDEDGKVRVGEGAPDLEISGWPSIVRRRVRSCQSGSGSLNPGHLRANLQLQKVVGAGLRISLVVLESQTETVVEVSDIDFDGPSLAFDGFSASNG